MASPYPIVLLPAGDHPPRFEMYYQMPGGLVRILAPPLRPGEALECIAQNAAVYAPRAWWPQGDLRDE